MAWVNLEEAIKYWPDAENIDPFVLNDLLNIAWEQCVAYAPAFTGPPSKRFILANIYQAREIWASGSRDSQDLIGFGDYAVRARPMTATVKSLLRPETRGVIG